MKDEDYPVVKAVYRNKKKMLKMYCKYCEMWHGHGPGEGHRVAHCIKDTPYKKTGYILQIDQEHDEQTEK